MSDAEQQWEQVAAILHEALPDIDAILALENIPISERKRKAFGIIQETMLENSDNQAFYMSDAHGRFLIIISEWYRDRYGEPESSNDGQHFLSMVLLHETPFTLSVPKNIKTPPDDEGCIWIGFPASVQDEDLPLDWIENQAVLKKLDRETREKILLAVTETANLVRSIAYDLRALESDPQVDIVELAESIGADLQASARHLCERNQGGLRASMWDVSQATEKALKLFIMCKGETPPKTHDLGKLAEQAECLQSSIIDRRMLAQIPSNNDATNIRYGGCVELSDVIAAYEAGLRISRQLLFEATPALQPNVRNARIKLKTPPWFDFDTENFVKSLRAQFSELPPNEG